MPPKKTAAPIRLLLVDASPDFGERLQGQLRGAGLNVRVERVATRPALEESVARRDSDLLLVDWESPVAKPAEVVSLVERERLDLPVIALAVSIDAGMLLAATKARISSLMLREEPAHVEDVIRREYARRRQRLALASAEARIRELEQRCDAMLESSRDAIAYVHEGMHVRANPAYLELFGVSSFEDIEGTTLLDMIDPSTAGALKDALKRLGKDEAPGDAIEISAQRFDGSSFDAEILFARASFEGEPCFQITVRRREVLYASDVDPLTGLANRQSVFKACAELVAGLGPGTHDAALLLVEPDGFDRVAEAVGIAQADDLIRQVAAGMREFGQTEDMVARYSDHGFVLLLRGTSHDEAQARAEALRDAFAGHVFDVGNRSFPVTVSAGLVLVSDAIASSDDLLGRVSRALKQAQDAGGNQVVVDDPAAREKADAAAEKALLGIVRDAIEHDGLVLSFQPVVSLQGAEGELFQVLVRLNGPDGEMLPAEFFPIAEKYGLLAAIDRCVVGHACKAIASRAREGRETTLFVKLNPHSLDDEGLISSIGQLIRKAGIDGKSLVFEFTESTVGTNLNGVRQFREALGAIGCRFAIQDFGAAANAQQIVQHVGADFVKLDRRLMADLPKSADHQGKLRELCALAHSAGRLTVAQFVEDAASMAVLFNLGVDFVQGNFLSEPEQVVSAA
jgi:diguanylate cyclase (GGDEF)-like protein/PAS domain S-box-containing protein